MRRIFGVLLVLLSLIGLPAAGSAQTTGEGEPPGQQGGFELKQNFPNPFNPSTTIPFVLNEDLFSDGNAVRVSVRIYNMLQQLVAVPVALRHPAGEGVRVENLEYSGPGEYQTFWDGRDRTGREVASGLYYVQLTVNGVSKLMKMLVTK